MKVLAPNLCFYNTTAISKVRDRANSVKDVLVLALVLVVALRQVI